MTDTSENHIVNPSMTIFCFISKISLEEILRSPLQLHMQLFPFCGQMRKWVMDLYDGSKTSCHENEVMLLKSSCSYE